MGAWTASARERAERERSRAPWRLPQGLWRVGGSEWMREWRRKGWRGVLGAGGARSGESPGRTCRPAPFGWIGKSCLGGGTRSCSRGGRTCPRPAQSAKARAHPQTAAASTRPAALPAAAAPPPAHSPPAPPAPTAVVSAPPSPENSVRTIGSVNLNPSPTGVLWARRVGLGGRPWRRRGAGRRRGAARRAPRARERQEVAEAAARGAEGLGGRRAVAAREGRRQERVVEERVREGAGPRRARRRPRRALFRRAPRRWRAGRPGTRPSRRRSCRS
jgi:hypothetical protein